MKLNASSRFCTFATVALGTTIALGTSAFAATLLDSFTAAEGYTAGAIAGQAGPGTAAGWTSSTWATPGAAAGMSYTADPTGNGKIVISGTNTTTGQGAIARVYSDQAGPYTLKFSTTFADLTGFSTTNSSSVIDFFGRPGTNSTFGSNGTWLVSARGNVNSGAISFYNGGKNSGGFSTNNLVSSGITPTAGRTYDFTLNFLGNGDWTGSVTDGITTFNSNTLGFRTNSTTLPDSFAFGTATAANAGNLNLSLDSIQTIPQTIAQTIPEPTAASLLGIALATGLMRRRRL